MDQGTGHCTQGQSAPVIDTMDQGTGHCTQGQSTPVTDTMDQGTGGCTQGQSTPVTDTMDQGTGGCTQGQSTPVTHTMDQGTGHCTQGQSTPVIDDFVVKVELPWSVKEEPQDELSAVYSPVQPMSDNTSGSLLSQNTSRACQRCSAVFMLSSSLEVHMETFHGETLHSELPVASRLQDSACKDTDVQKLEPAWSVKEEPQDQSSAVYSTGQPMTDNTSGSLLSLNTVSYHACHRCFAAFVLFSSLELHMGFVAARALKTHQRSHAAEKPYTCPHCPAAFAQSCGLKMHEQKWHH
ncbi:hypothetical protein ACOMHN_025229 [Nucella lapillus]